MSASVPQPLDVAWPAAPDTVPLARHAVLRYLEAVHTPDPPLKDVGLVVSEGVTNVVNHAYRDIERGEVRVRVEVHDQELQLTIEDDGLGMMPRPDSPGLGLGLPLIATVSERFDTRTQPDGGTRLCVWFRRDPAAATLPGQALGMFLFFSNRMGCLGSLLLSAAVTLVLLLLLGVLD